jgi:hypothetical protein
MIPTQPIIIDGETYDRYTASLAFMVRHNPDGTSTTSCNVRLVPTRITEDGQVITADAHGRNMLMGQEAGASADTLVAVNGIKQIGQAFIDGRGL